jgi:hypothetical protein
MKSTLISFAVLASTLIASSANADVSGPWRVSGKLASFAFTLNCDFKPDGAALGGVCVDASTNDPKVASGKSHPLTAGNVDGDKVSWTYQSSFLLTKFNVTFKGVQSGDRMSGTMTAQGHDGAFTASRN